MDPTQLTALPSSDTAPGTWRRKAPRRDNLPKGAGRHQSTHSVFDWKSAVMPGTEPKYLRRSVDVDEALELAAGPFGFDIEWKPTFVKGQAQSPIAVLQLAKEDQILLVQLSAMHEFPQRLQAVLEDARIIKAGVGIMDDAKKLWREYGVSLLGAVELSHLARAVDGPRWTTGKARELISLTRLMETYQSRRLPKGKVRMSNWELPLTIHQINYAASDALAGCIVYRHLVGLNPEVPPESYTSDIIAGQKQPISKAKLPQSSRSTRSRIDQSELNCNRSTQFRLSSESNV